MAAAVENSNGADEQKVKSSAASVVNDDNADEQKVENNDGAAKQTVKASAAPVVNFGGKGSGAPIVNFFGSQQCKVIKLPSAADKNKVIVKFQYCGGECGYHQKYEAARVCTSPFLSILSDHSVFHMYRLSGSPRERIWR